MKEEVLRTLGKFAGKTIATIFSLFVIAVLIYFALCGILTWIRGGEYLDNVRYLWGLIVKR